MRDKINPMVFYEMSLAPAALEVVKVALELDVFTKLSKNYLTLKEICDGLSIHSRPGEMLLTACIALGLIKKEGKKYLNSKLSEECLVKSSRFYELCKGYIYGELGDGSLPWNRVKEAILSNKPILSKNSLGNPWLDERNREFHAKLHIVREKVMGEALARKFDFASYHTLLDVGGSSGGHCIAVAKRCPHIKAIVFDLPVACEIAKEKIAEAGLSKRIKVKRGDFFKDDFPEGVDVILFSHILHDWSKEDDIFLLKKAFNVLPKRGAIIVKEFLLNDEKTGPLISALQSFSVLMGTIDGFQLSGKEIIGMLSEVGFAKIRVKDIDDLHSIVTGVKR